MNHPLNKPIEFYRILHDIAVAYPPTYEANGGREITCKRLNGFGVIKSEDEVNAESLTKDLRYIGEGLFFGRSWYNSGQQPSNLNFEYPLLAISRVTTEKMNPFGNDSQDCVTFNMYIFDKMPGNCTSCPDQGYCNTRTWEQMECDLTDLLNTVLQSIGSFVYAELYKDGELLNEGYYDERYLKCLEEEDEIDSFECIDRIENYFGNKRKFDSDTFHNVYNDNLGVIAVNFRICFSNCGTDPQVKLNYKSIENYQEVGSACKNC